MTGCSSCYHQWLLSDSNLGPAGYMCCARTNKPRLNLLEVFSCRNKTKNIGEQVKAIGSLFHILRLSVEVRQLQTQATKTKAC